jgi:acyl-[acyl-carrier-protein]-phospholipid O-acyltransferase/long-chain-fatty-acid--[acyl-carrier-protein] ligase
MPAKAPAHEVRQAIQELGAAATAHRKRTGSRLDLLLVHRARRNWRRFGMADSTGRELTWGRVLAAAVLLSRWFRRNGRAQEMIGVLLPSTAAGALLNFGATLSGRVPVNLNFTTGPETMAAAIEQCGIRTIVTSRAFLAKAGIESLPGMVYVEDILGGAGKLAQLSALAAARLAPARFLARGGATPDSLATVVFSSGSTGVPKGVMLSHYNLLANIEAIEQVFRLNREDRIAGVLPFFHSFGFTITIWFPLIAGCGVVYHSNPTEAAAIGKLVAKYRATLLLSTPTFCATYTRKCAREDFATLRYVLVGAERLREPVATAFREKFGVELLEGYGCTEMSPVVAVNAAGFEAGRHTQTGAKAGTVGHPLPGVAVRIVDPATFAPLGPNTGGLLLVRGSNRMLGYLGQPDRTAEVLLGDWYVTGDIAVLDEDGFLSIRDRLSRFSKIAGEMAPHLKIEDEISVELGGAPCAVTGIPDDQRGERLVALYVKPEVSPSELWQRLNASALPRLWVPKRENLYQVNALPQLGTGKLDLRALKAQAEALSHILA